MDYITMRANAKINLALDVIGKRDDGYHDLEMIMQTVGLYDVLFMKKIHYPQISIISNIKWLPTDERNLVYQAAQVLLERFKPSQGIFIEINKNIPVCAGLGGGSADCAATLVGIRNLFNFPISNGELMEIGKSLGADVPYCIMRGTALAKGIGDKLTRLPAHPNVYVLLAKPNVGVSTASIFNAYDMNKPMKRPQISEMVQNIEKGDIEAVAHGFSNVLESVTIEKHPIISQIKQIMTDYKAYGALMSGSGPTVFGYFKDKSDAFQALKQIRYVLGVKETFITTIFNPWKD